MIRHLTLVSLLLFLITGCSSVRVVPVQVTGGLINPAEKSQTVVSKGVEITVRVDETGINSYNLESTVTALHVGIKNGTDAEVAFSEDSFILVDEGGLQYQPMTPDGVRAMLKKDSYYLVPYPYVGYYYLEDFEKSNAYNRFSSQLPYYYDLYPQDIFTKALPTVAIIPGMRIEGLTYFRIDPADHKDISLLIYRKGSSKSSPPDFSFPFKVEK